MKYVSKPFKIIFVRPEFQESATEEVLSNDDDPIGELYFDLNQLCEVNPGLTPANLQANELFDIDAGIETKNLQPLTVEKIFNDLNNEPYWESDDANHQNKENQWR